MGPRTLVLAGPLALLLAACSYSPSALMDWAVEPSCGAWKNLNQPETPEQERMNRCFLEAFEAGRPATLHTTTATVEGDPIRQYLRVLGPGEVEILIDATADRWGSQEWVHQVCKRVVENQGYMTAEDCRELPLDGTVSIAR